ncbi:MAG: DUF1684 domain-containing protein [Acidobacteriota bacterium]
MHTRRISAACLTVAVTFAAGCRQRIAPDPAYREAHERWRAERVAALTSESGWLTVVGLHWLEPGSNPFGAAPANRVVLRGAAVPPVAGTFDLGADGSVTLRTGPAAGVTMGGETVTERALRSDRSGRPDIVELGSLRLNVIERADRFAIRVKDLDSPARRNFKGIPAFPLDLAYRVEGTYEPYATPREVQVPSTHGPAQTMLAGGVVRFRLDGRELALEPFVSAPDDRKFFIVFRDATAGVETYGAGRFLTADAPARGSSRAALDFNRATNPPCAFTPHATCPLPPPGNVLPIRVEAGEKLPDAAH